MGLGAGKGDIHRPFPGPHKARPRWFCDQASVCLDIELQILVVCCYHEGVGRWAPRTYVDAISHLWNERKVLLLTAACQTQCLRHRLLAADTLKAQAPCCRALAGRRTPEYAPWSVASDSIIRVRRLLQLQNPGCADRWAAFVRANVTTAFLAANSQLSLNASLANASDVQPDIQPRLLRPLLLGLAAEFDDPLVKQQALAMFAVSCPPASPLTRKALRHAHNRTPLFPLQLLLQSASRDVDPPFRPLRDVWHRRTRSVGIADKHVASRLHLAPVSTGSSRRRKVCLQDTSTQALKEDVDIRGTVYAIVAGTGQRSDYDAIKQIYLRVRPVTAQRRRLLQVVSVQHPVELTSFHMIGSAGIGRCRYLLWEDAS